jgi:hypothetical protein
MMVAMMLPSLVPMLWRYRRAVVRTAGTRLGWLTALVGMGYFFVWAVFGAAVYPLGVALAAIAMRQPALARTVPIAVGVVVLIAGSLQLIMWRARRGGSRLAAAPRGRTLAAGAGIAWRHGLQLGLRCSHRCAGLMAIYLVIGVMDLRAMAVVAAMIAVERFAPSPRLHPCDRDGDRVVQHRGGHFVECRLGKVDASPAQLLADTRAHLFDDPGACMLDGRGGVAGDPRRCSHVHFHAERDSQGADQRLPSPC